MTRLSPVLLALALGTLTLDAPPALAQHVHDHAPAPTPAPAIAPDHSTMDHSGTDHGSMDHSQMHHDGPMPAPATPGDPTPAGPRDPHAYADGYDNEPMSAHHMAPPRAFLLLVDKLEFQGNTRSADGLAWDIQGWSGGDVDRLGWRSEGAAAGHEVEADVEAFWAHAISPFWEVQAGIRQDLGDGPERSWAGIGIEGLAPYWFDVRASLYAAPSGRLAARLNVEYALLLTQRLVLTPELEADAYSETDRARGIGRGLSEVTLAARLRYELRREFAPYVGVSWTAKLGRTAALARADGASPREAAIVAGVRFWF